MTAGQTGTPTRANPTAEPTPVRASSRRRQRQNPITRALWMIAPALTFILLLVAWGLAVSAFKVPEYLLPAPADVIHRLGADNAIFWRDGLVTVQEIVLGFGLTIVTAIPLGLLIALSAPAKRVVYPLLVFVQLVPKIAIAPLFLVWFGFGMSSKVVLTILMTFFPLLLASISGFQILDTRFLYLTKSMGASVWQTFRYLRLPAALPVIFAGLKTAATIAATAAIVAEFVGANQGLGYQLLQGTSTLDTELIFSILLLLTFIGIALNYIVELVEFLVTPWQRKGNQ